MNRLVVFDCDGTLVDSQHAIVEAMRQAFVGKRLPPPAPAAVRRLVGLSLAEAVAALLPEGGENCAALERDFRAAFLAIRQRPDHHEPLFPGAAEAIDALDAAGYLLGVATGKSRRGLGATLDRVGLGNRFVTLQTADDAPSKPNPEMLRRAMAEAGAEPEDTVFVGDTTFDMEMALGAGAAPIGVSWGYHDAGDLRVAGARLVVDTFAALPDAVAVIADPPAIDPR